LRDAIGGALTIQIILVFLILVNGYLAITVNYTKAFRVKNGIVSVIERNEGLTETAGKSITELMRNAAYSVPLPYLNKCYEQGYSPVYPSQLSSLGAGSTGGGFCYKRTDIDPTGSGVYTGREYSVVTYVNINVPGLNRIFQLVPHIFSVKGETKTIYSNKRDWFSSCRRWDANGNCIS